MKTFSLLLGLTSIILLTGCVDINYVGQEFGALPEKTEVKIYKNKQDMPVGKYTAIGKVEITGPRKMDAYDVRDTLATLAKSKGAKVVLLVESNIKSSGVYNPAFEGENSPSGGNPNYGPLNKKFTSLGKEASLSKEVALKRNRVVKAIFYKDKKEVETALNKLVKK
jgi:hypothetical protein